MSGFESYFLSNHGIVLVFGILLYFWVSGHISCERRGSAVVPDRILRVSLDMESGAGNAVYRLGRNGGAVEIDRAETPGRQSRTAADGWSGHAGGFIAAAGQYGEHPRRDGGGKDHWWSCRATPWACSTATSWPPE